MENKNIIFAVIVFAISCAYCAFAWTAPTAAPPNENASAPINVSDSDQTKDGSFSLGKFFQLKTSNQPTSPANGMAYFDNTNLKCRENDKWWNCVGGYFKYVSASLIELVEKTRIGNVAAPTNPSDVATKEYVDAQMAIGGGGGIRWYIKVTPAKHDGNFGGWPGIDRFCQEQLGPECVVFSSDILNSAYNTEETLNFSSWDTGISTQGWFGFRELTVNDYTGVKYAGTYPFNWATAGRNCGGYTANVGGTSGMIMISSGQTVSISCAGPQNVLCACPTP